MDRRFAAIAKWPRRDRKTHGRVAGDSPRDTRDPYQPWIGPVAMWGRLVDYAKQLFALQGTIQSHETDMPEIRQELKESLAFLLRLIQNPLTDPHPWLPVRFRTCVLLTRQPRRFGRPRA